MTTPFKQWMEDEGFTNSTLAERLGVTYDFVYKVANGLRPVGNSLKWRIAREFGIDVAERVAHGADEPQPEPATL